MKKNTRPGNKEKKGTKKKVRKAKESRPENI